MSDAAKKISRGWCFTLNNYTSCEHAELLGAESVYLCIGEEVGESGTPHLQGYIYFRTEKSLRQCRLLSDRAHWEIARGSPEDNLAYCSKDGKFEERGQIPMSKKRKAKASGDAEIERWDNARKAAKTGDFESIPSDIYLRYYRTLKEIAKDNMPKPGDAADLTGVWIYGPAGCGKSRSARELYPGAYFKMCNKWWDGYQSEEHVIIDDLDKKHDVLGHHLKIWADRYSFLAETKGGAIHIRPKTIVVTSQYSIDEIWEDQETRDALKRRFAVTEMVPIL